MRVLLDTCALSELSKPLPNPGVRAAVGRLRPADLYVSVLTAGEIGKGVALLSDGKRKSELTVWLQTLENTYADRMLPVDLETCRIWGELTAKAQRKGQVVPAQGVPAMDGLLAATAVRHGLHVMTRNVAHFEVTGVPLLNPWV